MFVPVNLSTFWIFSLLGWVALFLKWIFQINVLILNHLWWNDFKYAKTVPFFNIDLIFLSIFFFSIAVTLSW